MCRELEAIGLPDPRFNNDTFILKTTVRSASIGRESTQNASIQQNDASNQLIDTSIDEKAVILHRLNQLTDTREMSVKDAADARCIIGGVDVLQVITSSVVMAVLGCQTTKARHILKEMERLEIIKKVQGKGKGKFILNTPISGTVK